MRNALAVQLMHCPEDLCIRETRNEGEHRSDRHDRIAPLPDIHRRIEKFISEKIPIAMLSMVRERFSNAKTITTRRLKSREKV
jgi:hypothetical protein